MDKPNIAEMIIQYEKDKDMTDTQFAFESHLSVERVHNLKSGDYEPTADELKTVKEYIKLHQQQYLQFTLLSDCRMMVVFLFCFFDVMFS